MTETENLGNGFITRRPAQRRRTSLHSRLQRLRFWRNHRGCCEIASPGGYFEIDISEAIPVDDFPTSNRTGVVNIGHQRHRQVQAQGGGHELVNVSSGGFNNIWSGYSGCWLGLNSFNADVRLLRNCNCGFVACCNPAAVEALAGVELIKALWPYQERSMPEPKHGITPLATLPAHPRFGVPQGTSG